MAEDEARLLVLWNRRSIFAGIPGGSLSGELKPYTTTGFGVDGVKGFRLAYSVLMRIHVLYFGVLKDIFGRSGAEMELEEGASVAELVEVHRGLAGASVWDSIAVAVNQEYARAGDVLKDGDEVALLPPVSGGMEATRATAGLFDKLRAGSSTTQIAKCASCFAPDDRVLRWMEKKADKYAG